MADIQKEDSFTEAYTQLKAGAAQGQAVTLSAGQVRIVLQVIDDAVRREVTDKEGVRLGDLLAAAPADLWQDIDDGAQFARELRRRASRRRSLDEYLNE